MTDNILDIKNALIKKLTDAIAEMNSQMPKWIQSSERLPESDQYVLTYSKEHTPQIQIGFYSTVSRQWLKTSTAYVTHWMELPLIPEDE